MDEAIADHRAQRLSDLEYLRRAEDLTHQARNRSTQEGDPRLRGRESARAYLGLLQENLAGHLGERTDLDEHLTVAALIFEERIEILKIRDWHSNVGVRNRMIDAMDDHLYALEKAVGCRIPHSVRDVLFEKVLSVARHRDGYQSGE